MSQLTDYAEKTMIENALGIGNGFGHSTVYLALVSPYDPDALEQGSWSDEVGDANYARQGVFWGANQSIFGGRGRYVAETITFPEADSDYRVDGLAWADSSTEGGGNMLFFQALPDPPITVSAGQQLQFDPDSFAGYVV